MESVEQILSGTKFFDSLTADERRSIANRVTQVDFPAGTLIAAEGEVGYECYFILDGAIQVYTTTADGREIVLDKEEAGQYIGEQSLLPGSTGRRNASLRAWDNVSLLRITKKDFQTALSQNNPLKELLQHQDETQVQNRLLRQSGLYRSLVLSEQTEGWQREETFSDGEIVFRQGDPGDRGYLIVSGTADVFEETDNGLSFIRQLSTGLLFGERALLERQPRSATIRAHGDLKVLSIDGTRFVQLYEQSPEVREYMQTLRKIYPLPRGGFVTQYIGRLMGMECLTTVTSLLDDTTVVSSHTLGQDIFNMSIISKAERAVETLCFAEPEMGIERTLHIEDSTIVGVTSLGYWAELGIVYRMVLEGKPISTKQLTLFRQVGLLEREVAAPLYEDDEIVCNCLQIQRGQLRLAIEGGCHSADDLSESTGAGTICGACRPMLQEMVGNANWTSVHIAEVLPVAEDIRSFRLVPHTSGSQSNESQSNGLQPAKPGQHIVIQAQIDGRWIQRPYTISSAAQETSYREITVKREPQGLFSNWLFDERWNGTPIRVSEPQGDYFADLSSLDPIVCLVGGIGVTPALAMCRSIIQANAAQQLHIDYCATTREQFAYGEELQMAMADRENITVNLRATKEDGRLSAATVKQLARQYPNAHYYICGPAAYQHTAESFLKEAAVPAMRINIEEFTPVGDSPTAPDRRYFYLGLALVSAFALQDIFQIKWPWFEALQAGESYRRWSGLLLTLYIAAQFILPILRVRGNVKAAARHYHLHKWQGAAAPLVYYLHATAIGYAYLLVLSIVYFANFVLGLFNGEMVKKPESRQKYTFYWIAVHVILSVITVVLAGYHIYIVFAYQ